MKTEREPIHTFATRVRRSIAGDLQARDRYLEAGDTTRAQECEASAAAWAADITRRLGGGR